VHLKYSKTASPRSPLEELTALPQTPSLVEKGLTVHSPGVPRAFSPLGLTTLPLGPCWTPCMCTVVHLLGLTGGGSKSHPAPDPWLLYLSLCFLHYGTVGLSDIPLITLYTSPYFTDDIIPNIYN